MKRRRRSAINVNVRAFLTLAGALTLLGWFIDGILTRNGFALTLAGILLVVAALWVVDVLWGPTDE